MSVVHTMPFSVVTPAKAGIHPGVGLNSHGGLACMAACAAMTALRREVAR